MSRIHGREAGSNPAPDIPTPAADHASTIVRPTPLVLADAQEIERRFTQLATSGDLYAEPLIPPEVGDHVLFLIEHSDQLSAMLDEMGRFAKLDVGIITEIKEMIDDAAQFARARSSSDPLGMVRAIALELGADPALYDRVAADVRKGEVNTAALEELISQMHLVSDREIAHLLRRIGIEGPGS